MMGFGFSVNSQTDFPPKIPVDGEIGSSKVLSPLYLVSQATPSA